jgi:hypothetical protein
LPGCRESSLCLFREVERVNVRSEMFLSKVFLSIAGGIVLTALFFMSHAPLTDLFHPHESMSLVHLCFGLFFFVVLFWLGFSVTWVIYSLIVWFADTVRYNIRYREKGQKDEQNTMQLTGPQAETAPIPETQGQPKIENEQAEDQTPSTFFEDQKGTQGPSLSEGQSEEFMLTSEEFSGLINDSGLTINQAAEKLGVSRQMVSYIIHGKRSMTERISDKARDVFRHHR